MAIKKQAFYEGAALHILACAGDVTSIHREPPFFLLNKRLLVLLKYCTKGRSPWAFTFGIDEQVFLANRASESRLVFGLVCGGDGVAALPYEAYLSIASVRRATVHIACYRQHAEHYEINGPDGKLSSKVSPAMWERILQTLGKHRETL